MKVRILVAEDDAHIREGLVDTLESEGYDVVIAADGRQALARFASDRPDLVLLDVMMPGMSGYDVCRALRAGDARIPIAMLTAKGEEIDKVVGLQLGADDYITKPFGVRELLARIEALLRRARTPTHPPEPEPPVPDVFAFGPWHIDRKRYAARREDREVGLSDRELRLLQEFYLHPGEVLSRNHLLDRVWGVQYYGTTRTLDQHIAQLRKKIEPAPGPPTLITTVHGVGYRYRPLSAEGDYSGAPPS
jgi:DNA-binding response OmpR family regulator